MPSIPTIHHSLTPQWLAGWTLARGPPRVHDSIRLSRLRRARPKNIPDQERGRTAWVLTGRRQFSFRQKFVWNPRAKPTWRSVCPGNHSRFYRLSSPAKNNFSLVVFFLGQQKVVHIVQHMTFGCFLRTTVYRKLDQFLCAKCGYIPQLELFPCKMTFRGSPTSSCAGNETCPYSSSSLWSLWISLPSKQFTTLVLPKFATRWTRQKLELSNCFILSFK